MTAVKRLGKTQWPAGDRQCATDNELLWWGCRCRTNNKNDLKPEYLQQRTRTEASNKVFWYVAWTEALSQSNFWLLGRQNFRIEHSRKLPWWYEVWRGSEKVQSRCNFGRNEIRIRVRLPEFGPATGKSFHTDTRCVYQHTSRCCQDIAIIFRHGQSLAFRTATNAEGFVMLARYRCAHTTGRE